MILDKHLDWSPHFKVLYNKLARSNYLINSLKFKLPKFCLKRLYYSLFYSHLSYGLYIWGPNMSAYNIKKLCNSQKKCIRNISKSKYNSSTDALFLELNLLKLKDVIDLELYKIMYLNSIKNTTFQCWKIFFFL